MKLKLSILAFLLISSLSINAGWFTVDGITYSLASGYNGWNSEGLIVADGESCTGDVVIPDSVEYEGTMYAVRAIGKNAFGSSYSSNTGLTSITIPRTIVEIQGKAFYQCTALSDVRISDLSAWCKINFETGYANPTLYSHRITLNGKEITNLTIPDDVDKISAFAFVSDKSLTSLNIPNSVTYIGKEAFSGCSFREVNIGTGLQSVGLSGLSCSIDYLNISDLESWLKISWPVSIHGSNQWVNCPSPARFLLNGEVITSLEIPSTIKEIKAGAFSSMSHLKSVKIPNTVEKICDLGFYNCINIKSLEIPNSVTSIGESAFYGCKGLSSITLPTNITTIKDYTFYGTGIQSVSLSDSITSLGNGSFSYCHDLVAKADSNIVFGYSCLQKDQGCPWSLPCLHSYKPCVLHIKQVLLCHRPRGSSPWQEIADRHTIAKEISYQCGKQQIRKRLNVDNDITNQH